MLRAGDECEYKVHEENPNWTQFLQQAWMELPDFPLSDQCEKFMARSYDKNTSEGRMIDLEFIRDVFSQGFANKPIDEQIASFLKPVPNLKSGKTGLPVPQALLEATWHVRAIGTDIVPTKVTQRTPEELAAIKATAAAAEAEAAKTKANEVKAVNTSSSAAATATATNTAATGIDSDEEVTDSPLLSPSTAVSSSVRPSSESSKPTRRGRGVLIKADGAAPAVRRRRPAVSVASALRERRVQLAAAALIFGLIFSSLVPPYLLSLAGLGGHPALASGLVLVVELAFVIAHASLFSDAWARLLSPAPVDSSPVIGAGRVLARSNSVEVELDDNIEGCMSDTLIGDDDDDDDDEGQDEEEGQGELDDDQEKDDADDHELPTSVSGTVAPIADVTLLSSGSEEIGVPFKLSECASVSVPAWVERMYKGRLHQVFLVNVTLDGGDTWSTEKLASDFMYLAQQLTTVGGNGFKLELPKMIKKADAVAAFLVQGDLLDTFNQYIQRTYGKNIGLCEGMNVNMILCVCMSMILCGYVVVNMILCMYV